MNHRGEPMQHSQRHQSPQTGDNMASPRTPQRQKNRNESSRQSPQSSPTSSNHASRQLGNMPPSPSQQQAAQHRGKAPTSPSHSSPPTNFPNHASRQPGNEPTNFPNHALRQPGNMAASSQQGARQTNGMESKTVHLQQGGSSSSRGPSPTPGQGGSTSPRRAQNQGQVPWNVASAIVPREASQPEGDHYSNWQMGNAGYSPYDGTSSASSPYDYRHYQDFQVEMQSPTQYQVQRPAGAVPLIESTVIVPRTQPTWWARGKSCCGDTRMERRPRGVQQTSTNMAIAQKGGCCPDKSKKVHKQEYCCDPAPRTASRYTDWKTAWGEEIFGY